MRILAVVTALLGVARVALAGLPGDGEWVELSRAGPARWGHVMIYDPRRDRLLVQGGWTGSAFMNDVWEYPLASGGPWREITPSGLPPTGRAFHSAIYDASHDRMVLFGGFAGGALGDLWALDLEPDPPVWRALAATGTPPAPRFWHSAVDMAGRMVVFGGQSGSTFFDDVWELEMRLPTPAWSAPGAAFGTPPAARCCHEAVALPLLSHLLVFGGWNGFVELGDLWDLPYAMLPSPQWSPLLGAGAMGARTDHVAVLDWTRNRLVVHGGVAGAARLGDAWALPLADPSAWLPLAPSGAMPPPRGDHAAVYDPVRDRMLLFGGNPGDGSPILADLWALAWGENTAIHAICPADTSFAPGDTMFLRFDITTPFAAPTDFRFTITSERVWPFASLQAGIGVYEPGARLDWGFVVPDTAAMGTNRMTFRLWVNDAPVLADSCAVRLVHRTTPTRVSLIEAVAWSGEVRLAWHTAGMESFTLLRQVPGRPWQHAAWLEPDGSGRIAHTERDLAPGRYGYRLMGAEGEGPLDERWVQVLAPPSLALHRAWHRASTLWLDATWAGSGGARVELIDLAGRRAWSRGIAVGGEARERVSEDCDVPPGIYFVRVRQDERSAFGRLLVSR